MSKAIKLIDIAKMANTSIATVSRVLNNPDYKAANAALQQKILDLAKKNNYKPDTNALNLQKGFSMMNKKKISFYFGRAKTPTSDHFFSTVARSIEQQALMQGCSLGFSYGELETRDLYSQENSKDNDDTALIVIGRPDAEISKMIIKKYKNLVFTGLQTFFDEADQVICDGYVAAFTALSYLQSLNHTKIAYIGEVSNETRYRGYTDFLKENSLHVDKHLTIECPMSFEGGQNGAENLIKTGDIPSAIFCANDITALGVQSTLIDRGYSVPHDISVISIDNIELASFSKPLLTTISIPAKELGWFAVKLAISRLNNRHKKPVKITLPCKLIQRESCSKNQK